MGCSTVRFCLFGLLGPLVGFVVLIALNGGFKSHALEAFIIVLPFAFAAGLVPALIAAAFDRALDRWGARGTSKYLLTGAFGYWAAYLLMIENAFEITPLVPYDTKWGLIGAVPAVICSWITDKIDAAA